MPVALVMTVLAVADAVLIAFALNRFQRKTTA
jgi:hypothetical protein